MTATPHQSPKEPMSDQSNQFDEWAILEIMGHQKFAGRVSEAVVAGTSFVRIDIPAIDGQDAFTKLFGGGSIYSITPTTEELATALAQTFQQRPVAHYDLPDEWKQKLRQPLLEASPAGGDQMK